MTNEEIIRAVEKRLWDACELSDSIFDRPETGGNEYYACEKLTEVLSTNGFQTERGVGGLDTAFRAEWRNGEGGPSIGLICEYDALPELGHGCGHHMQGPTIAAAAIALKETAGKEPFRIVVYGTPDEEYGNGKITMLKEGCFRDIDVALMVHAGPDTTVDVKSLAQKTYFAEFFGKASHAALKPEDGRSATDAMLLAIHGTELLREHVRDDVRLHYLILDAGKASNVVPDYARIEFDLRSYSSEYLAHVCRRFEKVLDGAALMTETEVKYSEVFDCKAKIPVRPLNERFMRYAELLNAPQRIPFREKTGSTDFGNVLHEIPGASFRIAFVPHGTAAHSEGFLSAGKSESMHEAIGTAAEVIAMTARDMIAEPAFLSQIKEEYRSVLEAEKLEAR